MSLTDRLRGVIRPAAAARPVLPQLDADQAADVLGGEWQEALGQRFLVVDRRYSPGYRHGQLPIADVLPPSDGIWPTLPLLAGEARSGDASDAPRPSRRLLFVDLETTGLAGGAGTYAFLVGCGWFDGGCFRTRQFVLTSFAAEGALLEAVADVARDAGTVITYNGKSFDLPLIETRFLLHRRGTPFAGMPHVDMLHPARRLWRNDEEGCRLTALEQTLCGVVREGDVPGFEIPARYFHYVHSGDARPLAAVLEHNRLDVMSLACLTARAAVLLGEGPAGARGAREALGLGRLYERGGRLQQARACFMRACALGDDDPPLLAEALRAYAIVSRRLRCYEDAAAAWRRILDVAGCAAALVREASEALAVHHEHRARDLRVARALTMRSLTCSGTMARRQSLEHRLARLERKLVGESAGLF